MDELYLDNIDEYVNDHNKIVTYKWLSLTLGVHVNTAKQMLYHYLDHKRKESSAQLNATYLVSGRCVDNGQASHKVSVVKEDQLEDFKSKMSVVVSVHVYSVQKSLLKDSGPLYSVDYDAFKDNLSNCSKYSAIRCAGAVPMSCAELQRDAQRAPSPEPTHRRPNGDTHTAAAAKPKPQKGIMGMFGSKSAPKGQDKEVKMEPKEEAPVVDSNKEKPTAKVNPMTNFFGSQTARKADKKVKEEEEVAVRSPAPAEQKQPSPPKMEEKPPAAAAAAAAVHAKKDTKKDTKKDSRSKSKRLQDSDSEEEEQAMEKKRRRRIRKPEPDSSDEDVVPDSPEQMETREPTPSPEKTQPLAHTQQTSSEGKTRKRRRVLKSRTFLDEDGCMVTEKGYESESYSETEEEVQAKKPPPKNPFPAKASGASKEEQKKSHKKSSANAKGSKQASIMGFFQKK